MIKPIKLEGYTLAAQKDALIDERVLSILIGFDMRSAPIFGKELAQLMIVFLFPELIFASRKLIEAHGRFFSGMAAKWNILAKKFLVVVSSRVLPICALD